MTVWESEGGITTKAIRLFLYTSRHAGIFFMPVYNHAVYSPYTVIDKKVYSSRIIVDI
jgi:hypothetical protein